MTLATGLFKLSIETPTGTDYGVAYMADGKLRGGDSGMAYVGTYKLNGDKLTAELCVTQAPPRARLRLRAGLQRHGGADGGAGGGITADVRGSSRDMPSVRFSARLSHIAE
jgi:hypothetical protein